MTQAEADAVMHVQDKIRKHKALMRKAMTIEEKIEHSHLAKKYKLLLHMFLK